MVKVEILCKDLSFSHLRLISDVFPEKKYLEFLSTKDDPATRNFLYEKFTVRRAKEIKLLLPRSKTPLTGSNKTTLVPVKNYPFLLTCLAQGVSFLLLLAGIGAMIIALGALADGTSLAQLAIACSSFLKITPLILGIVGAVVAAIGGVSTLGVMGFFTESNVNKHTMNTAPTGVYTVRA